MNVLQDSGADRSSGVLSCRTEKGKTDITTRDTVDFMGVKVDNLDTRQLLERILCYASGSRQRLVMYVNADCMLIARKNRDYKKLLNSADILYPDGIGVVLGARFLGLGMAARSTAADFMPDFCSHFAERGYKIFLLGAREGVASKAALRLLEKVPNLKIAGTHHGYFTQDETEKVISLINNSGAHILLVGLGAPYQEFWITRNRDLLSPRILWGVGGLFDFLSGSTPRGPQWLLDNGFEWLCRLMAEPRRLWRRYLIGNMVFIAMVFFQRFFRQQE